MLTIREIKDILRQEHLSISRRRGQNFLVEQRVQKRIIDAMNIGPNANLLEIGPGLGALTEDLAKQAACVFAVEKDRALACVLQKMLSRYNNLQIIHQDILKTNFKNLGKQKLIVVGNLPYYITTPIIGYLLEKQRQMIKEIFISVQYEVGKRLVAKVGTKDYSALSIFVQYFTHPTILFSIPKRAFYPQPKVDSVFVHLHILSRPSVRVRKQEQFFKIVRLCFNQRRKTMLNSLTHRLNKTEKINIQQILQEESINFRARPEDLSLGEFARIENIFYKKGVRF